jgi:hypothetical protein
VTYSSLFTLFQFILVVLRAQTDTLVCTFSRLTFVTYFRSTHAHVLTGGLILSNYLTAIGDNTPLQGAGLRVQTDSHMSLSLIMHLTGGLILSNYLTAIGDNTPLQGAISFSGSFDPYMYATFHHSQHVWQPVLQVGSIKLVSIPSHICLALPCLVFLSMVNIKHSSIYVRDFPPLATRVPAGAAGAWCDVI